MQSSTDAAGVPRARPDAAAPESVADAIPHGPSPTSAGHGHVHPQTQAPSRNHRERTESSDLNSSILIVDHPEGGQEQDIDSIDDDDDDDDDDNDDDAASFNSLDSDAEREWEESKRQLELMFNLVMIPFIGKFLGRKCAYWGWAKFMEWKYPLDIEVSTRASLVDSGDGQPRVKARASI